MTGLELKKLRESTGLSQDRFGILVLDKPGATVCRWERGAWPIPKLVAEGIKRSVENYLRKKSE